LNRVAKFDAYSMPSLLEQEVVIPREQPCSTIEQECLAIVWAIKSVHVYVYGRHFKLETDYALLTWLQRMKNKNQKLTRWRLVLQQHHFVDSHVPGRENLYADWLSRRD
jgi:hypothetical protein